jgi:hypothetical protein
LVILLPVTVIVACTVPNGSSTTGPAMVRVVMAVGCGVAVVFGVAVAVGWG